MSENTSFSISLFNVPLIYPFDPLLLFSIFTIIIQPIWWNAVARREYKSKFLTKLCGGPYNGCYLLAAAIFLTSLFRDWIFFQAIGNQPRLEIFDIAIINNLASISFLAGITLVISSMWVLGITGTYLGDYFGILMDERVTSFPFNVLENPMYTGSTIAFFSQAIWERSFAGIFLSCIVGITYYFALQYEGPFTNQIYAKRSKLKKPKKDTSKKIKLPRKKFSKN
eukprot:TRINITY_DN1193_c0_g1_i1.p1 TRINITY_DN1193_c0_g1~~TRINITY_DN1193_c0_g1_i1.p1  ORF type:complete len:225 (+),score=60.21 TRINITY_DN1193_c0_g1_i1:96-770(+)